MCRYVAPLFWPLRRLRHFTSWHWTLTPGAAGRINKNRNPGDQGLERSGFICRDHLEGCVPVWWSRQQSSCSNHKYPHMKHWTNKSKCQPSAGEGGPKCCDLGFKDSGVGDGNGIVQAKTRILGCKDAPRKLLMIIRMIWVGLTDEALNVFLSLCFSVSIWTYVNIYFLLITQTQHPSILSDSKQSNLIIY